MCYIKNTMPVGYTKKVSITSKVCKECGKTYKPKQDHQIFCSLKCKTRNWKMSHKDRYKAWDLKWQRKDYATNPIKYYLKNLKRESLKKESGYKLTNDDWQLIKSKYGFRCAFCTKLEIEVKLTVDHIIPLALGGKHIFSNIQPLCKSCNSRKGSYTGQKKV